METTDYEAIENWHSDDGQTWKPGPLALRAVNPSGLTEWQVVDDGNAMVASVGLPELAASVGLPSAVFVSVQMGTSDSGVINPNADWALTVDVAQLFDDAVISPLKSYIGEFGVAFALYISGILKDTGALPPVIRLAMSCYWGTSSSGSARNGTFISEVTTSVPQVKELTQKEVVSDDICPHCFRSDGDGAWTIVARP